MNECKMQNGKCKMQNAEYRIAARLVFHFAFFISAFCISRLLARGRGPAEELGVAEQQAFRAAVDRVAPCVVRIETVGGLERVGGLLFGTGPTTGLVVTPDGYIVSSAFNFLHRPASILVQLPDGTPQGGPARGHRPQPHDRAA